MNDSSNMKQWKFVYLILVCLIGGSIVWAKDSVFYPNTPPHTPESMMEMTYAAAKYLQQTGDIAEFNKKEGKFTKGTILDYRFIMVLECSSFTMLTHPFVPQIVGKKGLLKKVKDTRGKLFHAVMCRKIDQHPKGVWITTYQIVPTQKSSASMVMFGLKVKGTPYTVAMVGRQIDLSEKELNEKISPWKQQYYSSK